MSETNIKPDVRELLVSDLIKSEKNPRKTFPVAEAKELETSIANNGLLHPLLVRPLGERFEIVCGERRWRAHRALKRETIRCEVREMTDKEMEIAQLAENVNRKSLKPSEEAAAICQLDWTKTEVRDCLGVGVKWVQDRLDLGELPEVFKKAIDEGRVSVRSVGSLKLVDPGDLEAVQKDLFELEEEWTPETLRVHLQERYLAPRARRKRWHDYWEGVKEGWGEKAVPCEDPELSSKYVHSYGEGVGKWRLASDEIGGKAARPEEAKMTWGQLAEAHGIPGVLVPAGGVIDPEKWQNVKLMIDSSAVDAVERAARGNGDPYTLGPKKGVVPESAQKDEGVVAVPVDPELSEVDQRRWEELRDLISDLKSLAWNPKPKEQEFWTEYNEKLEAINGFWESPTEED